MKAMPSEQRRPRSNPRKPAGTKGRIEFSPEGIKRKVIEFPPGQRERELVIAEIFVKDIARCDPSLGQLSGLMQNDRDDLDFTITIKHGKKQLELAEVAPLNGPYDKSPKEFAVGELARATCDLIYDKSQHHGGLGHYLLLYVTHAPFTILPPVQELVRRILERNPPRFDGVYFLSPHDEESGYTWKLFPAPPHPIYSQFGDEALAAACLLRPDLDMVEG